MEEMVPESTRTVRDEEVRLCIKDMISILAIRCWVSNECPWEAFGENLGCCTICLSTYLMIHQIMVERSTYLSSPSSREERAPILRSSSTIMVCALIRSMFVMDCLVRYD